MAKVTIRKNGRVIKTHSNARYQRSGRTVKVYSLSSGKRLGSYSNCEVEAVAPKKKSYRKKKSGYRRY